MWRRKEQLAAVDEKQVTEIRWKAALLERLHVWKWTNLQTVCWYEVKPKYTHTQTHTSSPLTSIALNKISQACLAPDRTADKVSY